MGKYPQSEVNRLLISFEPKGGFEVSSIVLGGRAVVVRKYLILDRKRRLLAVSAYRRK